MQMIFVFLENRKINFNSTLEKKNPYQVISVCVNIDKHRDLTRSDDLICRSLLHTTGGCLSNRLSHYQHGASRTAADDTAEYQQSGLQWTKFVSSLTYCSYM